MPLTLLKHKSWNIYSKETQARIARDEAEAQKQEEAYNRRVQDYEAAKRTAALQNGTPHPQLESFEDFARANRRVGHEERRHGRLDRKRKRRLPGEDETDRDLRLAREDLQDSSAGLRVASDDGGVRHKRHKIDAPITDEAGHINLFPEDRGHKRKRGGEEKHQARRTQAQPPSNESAVGNILNKGAWYSSAKHSRTEPKGDSDVLSEYRNPTDAFGRPDQARLERERKRQIANDPLTLMNDLWAKTKAHCDAKAEWEKQRKEELRQLKREQREREREERRERRRHGHRHRRREDDEDSMEGFLLDAPAENGKGRDRDRHGNRRSRRHGDGDGERTSRHRSHREREGDESRYRRDDAGQKRPHRHNDSRIRRSSRDKDSRDKRNQTA